MLFRVFKKGELEKLFGVLSSCNGVVGPVEIGRDSKGMPLYGFGEVDSFDKLRLGYTTTKLSPKKYFLPHREDLATFSIEGGDWKKKTDYTISRPRILFGLHACDINALNKLDKVLIESAYPMPYYASKRKNTFIIGIDCTPCPSCFCRSLGTDTALHGFDMFLTDMGDRYFTEVLSATAYNFLKKIETTEPAESHHAAYMQKTAERNRKFTAHVDTTDLMKILDMEFQSQVWEKWGELCLGCGACASVCPTCYCYNVEETIDTNLRSAKKTKMLYSCNIVDFATVAGGHNFRKQRHVRLKYRFYHKHRGFVEAYEEPLCVGCGRCGEACLAGITVPEVISSIRGEGERHG